MFNWLLSWFKKPAQYELYYPSQRRIYQYYDGKKVVSADPLVLYKKMMQWGGDLDTDIKVASSISKDASDAHDKLITKIQTIFDIKSFSDGGLTQDEMIALLDHFLGFNETVKKKLEPVCDLICEYGTELFFNRKPTYIEFFGLWLNRKRNQYRRAGAVSYGVSVALGLVDPGLQYYEAITDSKAEAKSMKAIIEAARQVQNG